MTQFSKQKQFMLMLANKKNKPKNNCILRLAPEYRIQQERFRYRKNKYLWSDDDENEPHWLLQSVLLEKFNVKSSDSRGKSKLSEQYSEMIFALYDYIQLALFAFVNGESNVCMCVHKHIGKSTKFFDTTVCVKVL